MEGKLLNQNQEKGLILGTSGHLDNILCDS